MTSLRFKVDENLPRDAVQTLRAGGFDAMHTLEQGMGGASDVVVQSVCEAEERVLITLDRDFADIRRYPTTSHPGAIVLRLSRQSRARTVAAIERVVALLCERLPSGQLWIVDEQAVRIRSSPT